MEIRLERPSLWKEFSSVQLLRHVRLFVIPQTTALQASLSTTNSQSLLKLMFIELATPSISSSVIPFSSCPQSFPESGSFPVSQLFASGGQIIGGSALASVLPVKYSELIFLRIDWLDLLAVQGTLKSLLQHHSSKASILPSTPPFLLSRFHVLHV